MINASPLSCALDESVAALADAIEVYYRSSASDGTASIEVREALSRAMKWLSEASRLEFDQRRAAESEGTPELALESGAWPSQSPAMH